MRVPQASRRRCRRNRRPRRVCDCDVRSDENLVLDDQRNFLAARLDEVGKALADKICLERVANEEARGDARIGVDAGDAQGVVVIPHEPGTLIERIIVLGLVWGCSRIEHRVVEETWSTISGRVPPSERSAVADPRNQTTVKMHSGAIVAQVRTRDGQIIGDDVRPAGEIVPEGDLDRRAFLPNDYAAEMLVVLTGEKPSRIKAAQRCWPHRWSYAGILKLVDVDGVVRDTRYGRRRKIGAATPIVSMLRRVVPKSGIVIGLCENGQARPRNAR